MPSDWPKPEELRAEIERREYERRCEQHYKGSLDRSEEFAKAKRVAAEQDSLRKWGRRRAP